MILQLLYMWEFNKENNISYQDLKLKIKKKTNTNKKKKKKDNRKEIKVKKCHAAG